ncbi:hypothetical protein BTN49_2670 [Candidatus Enterovibrio escicola]|uniref:Uncharacterized protein n=1 Tax=Candidatus Enterovibrio escicola TaxID=1927127 RepID=A0A2A5T0M0_9GAMM|nr:hypothetical protein BTN49_2670 [Candidatus Enterovibrio escacola]
MFYFDKKNMKLLGSLILDKCFSSSMMKRYNHIMKNNLTYNTTHTCNHVKRRCFPKYLN